MNEIIEKASNIYFYLLKNKLVERESDLIQPYLENSSVRAAVNIMARNSGTQILEGSISVQLVVLPEGSLYATSFTHLKERFSAYKDKSEFNLVRFILMIYILEIDSSILSKNLFDTDGISLERLMLMVDETFNAILEGLDETTEQNWGIPIKELITLWNTKEPREDNREKLNSSTRTKQGLILYGIKTLLATEKMVRIHEEDGGYIIFPTIEFHERVEQIFHDNDRYQYNKLLLSRVREGNIDASNK